MISKIFKISVALSIIFLLSTNLASASILDVTNVGRLSLPGSTSVGQKVRISDGAFGLSGAGTSYVNGIYIESGTYNGKPYYIRVGGLEFSGGDVDQVYWDSGGAGAWSISAPGNVAVSGLAYASTENVAYPWLVTHWSNTATGATGSLPVPTVDRPGIQEYKLTAPISDQVGVSIINSDQANGIYLQQGTRGGKPYYKLIESDPNTDDGIGEIRWNSPVWEILNQSGDRASVSFDDVAYPWLATFPDSFASVTVNGAGTSAANGTYTLRGTTPNGAPYYNLIGHSDDPASFSVFFDDNSYEWYITGAGESQLYISDPWLITSGYGLPPKRVWVIQSGTLPVPTVTGNSPTNLISNSVVTQGEIDAGATVTGAGNLNGTYTKRGIVNYRNYYNLAGNENNESSGLYFEGSNAWALGSDPTYESNNSSIFPWDATAFPAVTRSNIAAEGNWALFTPVATSIQFDTQPSNANADTAISPSVTVQILDQDGDLITTATNNVTISIGTNTGSGTLSGTLTQAAVAGVATFDNLKIDKGGTGYTLTAAVSGAGTATSDSFNIIAVATPTTTTTYHSSGGRMVPPKTNLATPPNSTVVPPVPPTPPKCTIVSTLGVGWVGPQVKCLQTILNTKADGIFGKKTKTAVMNFQKTNGLKPDGIVGLLTRNKLNALLQ